MKQEEGLFEIECRETCRGFDSKRASGESLLREATRTIPLLDFPEKLGMHRADSVLGEFDCTGWFWK